MKENTEANEDAVYRSTKRRERKERERVIK